MIEQSDAEISSPAAPQLSRHEFEQFRRLAYERAGLDLRDGKEQLVMARLGKKLRELNLRSFKEYYRHITEDRTGESLIDMIDALTTNYTSFLREPAHFDFLTQVSLPEMQRDGAVSVWSAACATGEEVYSIAFCLLEKLGETALPKISILATDISTRALQTARIAAYPADRFAGVPLEWLRRYCLKGDGRWQGWYRIKPEIRRLIEFRRLNLVEPLCNIGPYRVIFCRNVMIYFDKSTQQQLVRNLSGCLKPGGHLLIGHAESLAGIDHPLQYVKPAIYKKRSEGRV